MHRYVRWLSVLALLSASAARAQTRTMVRLDYEGISGCQPRDAFAAQVAARLGFDPFGESSIRALIIRLGRTSDGFIGTLENEAGNARVFRAPECAQLISDHGTPVRAKSNAAYRTLAVDYDDDGRANAHPLVERLDLRLSHRADGSSLWSQTLPIPARAAQRTLQVIAHDFVDRVGGGTYFEVDFNESTVAARRWATSIREEVPVTVDGVEGYWVTFDLVSLDQRELNPEHQGERVTVVITRPSARWTARPRAYRPDARTSNSLPMLVLFGFASRAEHHEVHRQEFERLLGSVDFHETPALESGE